MLISDCTGAYTLCGLEDDEIYPGVAIPSPYRCTRCLTLSWLLITSMSDCFWCLSACLSSLFSISIYYIYLLSLFFSVTNCDVYAFFWLGVWMKYSFSSLIFFHSYNSSFIDFTFPLSICISSAWLWRMFSSSVSSLDWIILP